MLHSVPTDFHTDKRVSLDTGISPLLHPQGHRSHSASRPLFFTSSFLYPTQLCRKLSCPFWCPRSSASVQLVLCENCSICICILLIHIFLIHLWREMTSRSSYYLAILLFFMLLFHSSLTIILSLVTISAIFSCKHWDL